jgi:hypothetical protein
MNYSCREMERTGTNMLADVGGRQKPLAVVAAKHESMLAAEGLSRFRKLRAKSNYMLPSAGSHSRGSGASTTGGV